MSNTGATELTELILNSIIDEPFFNKKILYSKILAIINAFKLQLDFNNYNQIENPSNLAMQKRTNYILNQEKQFWHDIVKKIVDEEKMKFYYNERNEFLETNKLN